MRKSVCMFTILGASIGAASLAQAATDLQIDVNTLKIQATTGPNGTGANAFGGATHTGSLVLSLENTPAALDDVLIDGVSQSPNAMITSLSGVVNMTAGEITGGVITLTVQNPDLSLHTYTTSLVNTPADPTNPDTNGPAPIYFIEETSGGMFSDNNFGGVDVTPWQSIQPVPGSFLLSNYWPDSSGMGLLGQLELLVTVPEPATLGAVVLGAIGALGRRRR